MEPLLPSSVALFRQSSAFHLRPKRVWKQLVHSRIVNERWNRSGNNSWNQFYPVQFPYEINGRHFFYGQSDQGREWFIQELKENGTMGDEVTSGAWGYFYPVQFHYKIGGQVFLYGQSKEERNWFIQELKPDGQMVKSMADILCTDKVTRDVIGLSKS